jgi:FkbM family methyltransferase
MSGSATIPLVPARDPTTASWRMDADMAAAVGPDYERNVLAWIDRLLEGRPPPVVYDVGASFGFHTLHLAPRARHVYAFEPAPEPRAFLCENVRAAGYDNVTVLGLAVSADDGRATLRRYRHSFTHSLYARAPIGEKRNPERGATPVAVAALDSLLDREGLLPPGLIKLDAEGAELPALAGAREVIAAHRPLLVVEACEPICQIAGYGLGDLLAEIASDGYVTAGLASDYGDTRLRAPHADGVANLIAVAREDARAPMLDLGSGPP